MWRKTATQAVVISFVYSFVLSFLISLSKIAHCWQCKGKIWSLITERKPLINQISALLKGYFG